MHEYIMEFIGTFFLVLGIGLSNDPLAIGLLLAGLIYIGGHISGAHYNPAISLAFLINRKLPLHSFFGYLAAQLLGALSGAAVIVYLTTLAFVIAPSESAETLHIFLVEALLTYVLALVILVVAISKTYKDSSISGVVIGITLTALILIGSSISGAALNPAVYIGFAILDAVNGGASHQLIVLYSFAALLGGVLASITYTYFKNNSPNTF